jgi:hypothetical protein
MWINRTHGLSVTIAFPNTLTVLEKENDRTTKQHNIHTKRQNIDNKTAFVIAPVISAWLIHKYEAFENAHIPPKEQYRRQVHLDPSGTGMRSEVGQEGGGGGKRPRKYMDEGREDDRDNGRADKGFSNLGRWRFLTDSSVSIVTWTTGIRFSARAENFSPRHRVLTGSGAHQPPIQWVPRALSLGRSGRGVKLTTHFHLVPR